MNSPTKTNQQLSNQPQKEFTEYDGRGEARKNNKKLSFKNMFAMTC
jgi:hypothetical protein